MPRVLMTREDVCWIATPPAPTLVEPSRYQDPFEKTSRRTKRPALLLPAPILIAAWPPATDAISPSQDKDGDVDGNVVATTSPLAEGTDMHAQLVNAAAEVAEKVATATHTCLPWVSPTKS